MAKYWRYLKVLLTFRDVTRIYREDTGESTPGWMSRRFWGGVVLMVTLALKNFGTEIDSIQADLWVDTLYNAATGLISAYGVVMVIVGGFRRLPIAPPPPAAATEPATPAPASAAAKEPRFTIDYTTGGPNVPPAPEAPIDNAVDNDALPHDDPDVLRRDDPGTVEQTNPR
jgi:hypothetical protein